ncbi:MAG: RNA 3'-terminal phosphate cyclase [Candidatus Anammoxibacter sp.]
MIKIDGSFGEGGGQILRTALSLSALTGKPFEICNIRANRKKEGLRPQHLQCVKAVAEICNAQVTGAETGSTTVSFIPEKIKCGNYQFDIGTAGSVALTLHSIYLPLSVADGPSRITITGGTHVPFSPCYHYLELQWLPYIRKIGFDIELNMVRAGFYPRGNGEIVANISPIKCRENSNILKDVKPISLNKRGSLKSVKGISAVGNLNMDIAVRQKNQAIERLAAKGIKCDITLLEMPAFGKGTMLLLSALFEDSQCCYFDLGSIGKRAEQVADNACKRLITFLEGNGAVDAYLVDQLLLPLALSKGTATISTPKITNHIITNIGVIKKFVPVNAKIKGKLGGEGVINVDYE